MSTLWVSLTVNGSFLVLCTRDTGQMALLLLRHREWFYLMSTNLAQQNLQDKSSLQIPGKFREHLFGTKRSLSCRLWACGVCRLIWFGVCTTAGCIWCCVQSIKNANICRLWQYSMALLLQILYLAALYTFVGVFELFPSKHGFYRLPVELFSCQVNL